MISTHFYPLDLLRVPSRSQQKRMRYIGKSQPSTDLKLEHVEAARYLVSIASQTGCSRDLYVMNLGICIYNRISATISSTFDVTDRESLNDGIKLGSVARAAIIGSLSLAVDVAGDYEADYSRSALSWATLLNREVSGKPWVATGGVSRLRVSTEFDNINTHCRELLRVKLLIASRLDWQIRTPTVASTVSRAVQGLSVAKGCRQCMQMFEQGDTFMHFAEMLIQVCTLSLLPLGYKVEAISALVLLVAHTACLDVIKYIATPNSRVSCHRVKRQLEAAAVTPSDISMCLEITSNAFILKEHWDTAHCILAMELQSLNVFGEFVVGLINNKRITVLEKIEEAFEAYREMHSLDESE